MILSGEEIKKQVELGSISIYPFDERFLNPNSYDLHLGNDLIIVNDYEIDMRYGSIDHIRRNIPREGIVLMPGCLYLASTMQWTETKGFVPMIEGRSSIGRMGLLIHVSAGFGDNGFKGKWTLELVATRPIRIYAGERVCQIFYHTIDGDQTLYNGGYSGKTTAAVSKGSL